MVKNFKEMKSYRFYNIVVGWAAFLVAAITYLLTVEPTMSLWDCGEYILSGFKLEVGHPPGAPTFMLLSRFFALFASDVDNVALMVNTMSALASAFTIMFLFWSVTHLARRIVIPDGVAESPGRIIAVLGAGLTGALAYTFSDTFWFSAVEGEVYATSSLFTAITFWAILKWENEAEKPYADRWLIFIAYMVGLSIGVHLLNLLAIPAVICVYYFKRFTFSWKGLVTSLIVSVLILAFIMYGLIPGFVFLASRIELFTVNTIGLPYNSGFFVLIIAFVTSIVLAIRYTMAGPDRNRIALFAFLTLLFSGAWTIGGNPVLNILILAAFGAGIWYFAGRNRVIINTFLTSILVIMIGYSSFSVIMIRAAAQPPMNQNNPSTAMSMLYYLNREQYGSRPLVSGPYYNAPLESYVDDKPTYSPVDGKYKITNRSVEPIYDERFVTLFPRMWSQDPGHVRIYKQWVPVKGKPVRISSPEGEGRIEYKPTFGENLSFMFTYQAGFMYFRYFMWNFAGRQNDIQATGGPFNGNWISGIPFIDNLRLGPQESLPEGLKNVPSRNVYYLLPLLLGLAGLYYQMNRDIRNFWVVMLLFLMTGLAIVIYLNQYPNQPRERDYAYAASFYAFSIWIGMGVLFLWDLLSRLTGQKVAAPLAVILSLAAVPALMASQNWDDHDRSGRYTAPAIARNYLESCAPGAILFTNGDNDTFPLWYAQEVRGIRTDVRVCNLMLFNTDWYIEQMKKQAYESEPLPLTLPIEKYYDGVNNQVFIYERIKEPVEVKKVIEFIASNDPGTRLTLQNGEQRDYIPTRTIRIPVDRDKVLRSGTVKPEDADLIVPWIDITLTGNSILKSQMMTLDMLAHNEWERPVYFATGYHNDAFGLEEYFQLEGSAYRLVPIKSQNKNWLDYGRIDTDILYDNMINRFNWGNAKDPDVYLDYYHVRTFTVVRARLNYARLARALSEEGDNRRAIEVLDYVMEELPLEQLPWDMFMPDIIDAYLLAGATERALELSSAMEEYYRDRLIYYTSLSPQFRQMAENEVQSALSNLNRTGQILRQHGENERSYEINSMVQEYIERYTL
jgi:phage shock protein PspC (stress-responsive transcriptional regulator)